MKPFLRKIPAILAMLITLFSFFFYAVSFLDPESESWIVSVIVAMLSMPFYFIDAIISFVRAVKKDAPKFNYILTLVLIGSIPMVLIFGGDGKDYFNVIWNVYYLLVVVLEVISIKKACEAVKANRKKAKENTEV